MSEDDERHQKDVWMTVALVFIGVGVVLLILAIYLIYYSVKLSREVKTLQKEIEYMKKHPHCDCLITGDVMKNAEAAAITLDDYSKRIQKASKMARYIAPVDIEIQACKDPTKYTIAPAACGAKGNECLLPSRRADTKNKTTTLADNQPDPSKSFFGSDNRPFVPARPVIGGAPRDISG